MFNPQIKYITVHFPDRFVNAVGTSYDIENNALYIKGGPNLVTIFPMASVICIEVSTTPPKPQPQEPTRPEPLPTSPEPA